MHSRERKVSILTTSAVFLAIPLFYSCDCTRNESIVTDRSHDFGLVFVKPQDRSSFRLAHGFTVDNNSDSPLTLNYLGSSCSCTQPEVQIIKIAPFETDEIEVEIEVGGGIGQFNEHVVYRASHPPGSLLRLSLKAKVYPTLSVQQPEFRDIDLSLSTEDEFTFHVLQHAPVSTSPNVFGPIDVQVGAGSHNESLKIGVGEHETESMSDGHEIRKTPVKVRIDSTILRNATSSDQVTIPLTISTSAETLKHTIVLGLRRAIRSEPKEVLILADRNHVWQSQLVSLKADEPFSIVDIRVPSNKVVIEFAKDVPAKTHELKFAARKGVSQKNIEDIAVQILTTHPNAPQVEIRVQVMP